METKAENAKKNNSIMRKFVCGIIIPLIVILIMTGVLLNERLTKEIEALQEKNLQSEIKSASRLIEEYFEYYFSIIETTAALPLVQETLEEVSEHGESFRKSPYYDEMIEVLVEIQKLSPEAIQSLYITDFATSQYLRWDTRIPGKEWDITTRPYYALVKEAKNTILTPVFQNVAGLTVVSVCTPVFAADNETVIGTVNIDLGMDSLIESLNDISVGEEGYLILLDSTNKIISARDEGVFLKNIEEAGFSDALIEMVGARSEGNILFEYHDVLYNGNVDFVDKLNGWCILGLLPNEEYYQPIVSITAAVIACFVLCILILSVLCVLVVYKIIHPLKKLSGVVGELADGNFYVDCEAVGNDEIGLLAEGVSILVSRLQTYMSYFNESYEKMEHLAYSDALTGLGSRMAFNEKLKEYDRKEKIACVVADVNNLKRCNDEYGHSEGDKMIMDAADCICNAFQSIGTCYRIGGDEFCILIPGCEETQVLDALDKAAGLVAKKGEERKAPFSIAFGYAMREGITESMDELFKRSDAKMYHVKYRMKKGLNDTQKRSD